MLSDKAMRQRLERDAHAELDKLVRAALNLAAVDALASNGAERAAIDLLRKALVARTKRIRKAITAARIRPPKHDLIRGE